MPPFEEFLRNHPAYSAAFRSIEEHNRLLAISAAIVYEMNGEALGPVADEILSYVNSHYHSNYIEVYITRIEQLQEMDKRFTRNPSTATIGDSALIVDRDSYDLGLLLSIVFTNHRFEIIQQMRAFLRELKKVRGRIASIGAGPGYETKLIADALPDWRIESYDTNKEAQRHAAEFLKFFSQQAPIHFENLFPLDAPDPELRSQYDAIVLCEILEHLTDPGTALKTIRECLHEDGRAFVTMAINVAQEDHVFLYPDIASCRSQIEAAGLECVSEWIAPVAILKITGDRETKFKKGNYIATVRPA